MHATRQLSRVGVGGVYWAWEKGLGAGEQGSEDK